MNQQQDIKRNLISSAVLCILCIVLSMLCLWLRILEIATATAVLALFEALIFGIWYKRYRKAAQQKKNTDKFQKRA